jgi:hypothetical protein
MKIPDIIGIDVPVRITAAYIIIANIPKNVIFSHENKSWLRALPFMELNFLIQLLVKEKHKINGV